MATDQSNRTPREYGRPEWSPFPAALPNPFRLAGATLGMVTETMRALPRIADSLEQLVPLSGAIRELARLHGTLERLEKLGVFLAEELPEIQHQLDLTEQRLAEALRRLDHNGPRPARTHSSPETNSTRVLGSM